MYSVFLLLTFIPVLSKAYIQLSSFSSTHFLLPLQITMASANIMVHGASSLISSVILSITIANSKGSKPILGAVPPSPRTPLSLLPHTSPLLYCHRTYLVLLSHTSLPIQTFTSNNIPPLLEPCYDLKLQENITATWR